MPEAARIGCAENLDSEPEAATSGSCGHSIRPMTMMIEARTRISSILLRAEEPAGADVLGHRPGLARAP